MARDYKSRANPPSRRKAPVPGWVWFAVGVLVGAFATGLAWLKSDPRPPQPRAAAVVPPSQRAAEQAEPPAEEPAEASTPSKPRFDFYTILPEMEVVVPEPEESAPEPPTTTPVREAPVAAATAARDYMLQLGSFRKHADADRLKASLALVGIEAEIQRVTVNGGEVFHRVRSGPYGRDEANALRARLKSNNVNSLLIKLKG